VGERRYPLEPLVAASGLSLHALGMTVGLSGSSLAAARRLGLVEAAADRCACRLGLLPWLVWDDWLADLERQCASAPCTTRFVPLRRGHIYCSKRCTVRAAQRAYRARVKDREDFKQKARDYSRHYYRVAGPYVRARQRAYNQRIKREMAA
jgi:hypothetical protein